MKRIHVIIKGKVIGVFFRKFIKENADKLKIKGWVKNEKDYVFDRNEFGNFVGFSTSGSSWWRI